MTFRVVSLNHDGQPLHQKWHRPKVNNHFTDMAPHLLKESIRVTFFAIWLLNTKEIFPILHWFSIQMSLKAKQWQFVFSNGDALLFTCNKHIFEIYTLNMLMNSLGIFISQGHESHMILMKCSVPAHMIIFKYLLELYVDSSAHRYKL